MYTTKNVLLNGTAQSCSASATTVLSNPVGMSDQDSLRFMARVLLSAVGTSTGITFKLQEMPIDGVWEDVGSEAQATSVKKAVTQGTAEITDVTFPATAGATQADYVHFTAYDGTKYAVWLDLNAAGTVPTGALYVAADVKIKVGIVTGDTAAQVATKAKAAISTLMDSDFTVSAPATATITFTQLLGGAVADVAPKSANDGGAGSITTSTTTAGSDGNVNASTNVVSVTSHGLSTGQRVIYAAGTAAIGGLTAGTTYYVISVTSGTLKLATTQDNAYAGTAIDLTDAGQGTGALYAADYEIRVLVDDATDETQLPMWPLTRVVAVTGSGDTCTVSAVSVTRRR